MSGPLVDFLQFPTGEPNQNILALCRPGFRTTLRIACKKALTEQIDTECEARIQRGEETVECQIQVRLAKARRDGETLLLISFSDKARIGETAREPILKPPQDSKASSEIHDLERELKFNSDELEGVIEEMEDANEDLKISNEEITLMNEELQSANEELETSKEELQSLNEELSTVNSELLEKVFELDVANNDILNLISSTEIATLFLDNDLLILRFTPPTVKLLNLRSSDVGRPLSDIATRFVDSRLLTDCRQVIQTVLPIHAEIAGDDARLYLRRIFPYCAQDKKVVGVVITFLDLTDRLSLEKSLKESKEHLQAILDSAADSILTLDDQGMITSLNPATEILFGCRREEVLGNSILTLLTTTVAHGDSEKSPIQELLISKSGIGNYQELTARHNDGSAFAVELTINRTENLSLYIVVIRDISQRKELQSKILSIASEEQRRIGQELHDGTQQELTGLSLIAGAIEKFFKRTSPSVSNGNQTVTLDQVEHSRLMLSASKLLQGLNTANKHVQLLAHGIMPVQVDAKGLQSALTDLAHSSSVDGIIACQFICTESCEIKSNTVATHLYRIAQEAVNNSIKHGQANSICISLSVDQHCMYLEVSDDGVGLEASPTERSGKLNRGAGLEIMKYRANVIGGVLSVLAGSNNGTIVRCTIPRQRRLG